MRGESTLTRLHFCTFNSLLHLGNCIGRWIKSMYTAARYPSHSFRSIAIKGESEFLDSVLAVSSRRKMGFRHFLMVD